tara:strand:+ start:85 stop:588 length:504 start_codon:yes stop_codon:yes gene_type:complete
MNWDAISAIGETIGAVAVVISLLYLAVQIRQNTNHIKSNIAATELSAFERNIASGNRVREFFLLNPELLELYMKGRKSYKNLESNEKIRFDMIFRNVFSEIQGAYIRQWSIDHDPNGFLGLTKVVDQDVSCVGIQELLQLAEFDWRPEFKKFVFDRLEIVSGASPVD